MVSRGRQAEARRNDRAVLDAARLVFAVQGPEAPVSAVAAAAGVGMGSLYRRYSSKEALLQHLCQASMEQQIATAEACLGSGGEPWDALARFVETCVLFRAGAFTSIAGTIATTAAMNATAQRAHELVERLVRAAQRAGTLRQDVGSVDIHQLIELFSHRRPDDDGAHQRLLAIALDGLHTAGQRRLPGSTPTWKSSVQRWVRD
jgi:AcrR family transcriptional regulator